MTSVHDSKVNPTRVLPPLSTRTVNPALMTVPQAAELLGCSAMTIRRRIAVRQFPAVKTGRKSMIPRAFVERLVAEAEAGKTVVVDEAIEEWRGHGSDLSDAPLVSAEEPWPALNGFGPGSGVRS